MRVAVAGGRDIRCAPYATYGTEELSRHAVEALRGRKACLLANHGLIALGLGITGVVTNAGRDCYDMCVPPTLLGAVVVFGYLTNDIWSVVTAVQDAHAHNDRLRTVQIDVVPALRVAVPPGDAMRPRVEVQVLRATF